MRNKLGVIGGLILSLMIAGSAFAGTGGKTVKASGNLAKVVKPAKSKRHRKHKRAKRKVVKKAAAKTTTESPKPKQ